MPEREKVIEDVETAFDIWIDEYEGTSYYDIAKVKQAKADALTLLKEQEEKIHQFESMNVSASGNGTAIGVLHGGMTIKKEYHQQAKEVYNIGHVNRLDL